MASAVVWASAVAHEIRQSDKSGRHRCCQVLGGAWFAWHREGLWLSERVFFFRVARLKKHAVPRPRIWSHFMATNMPPDSGWALRVSIVLLVNWPDERVEHHRIEGRKVASFFGAVFLAIFADPNRNFACRASSVQRAFVRESQSSSKAASAVQKLPCTRQHLHAQLCSAFVHIDWPTVLVRGSSFGLLPGAARLCF